jgi:hypothetical protein
MTARKNDDADNIVRLTVTLTKETYRKVRFIAADRDVSAASLMSDELSKWAVREFEHLDVKGIRK